MANKPDSLTKQFIVEHAEYSLQSNSHYWRAWIWENIVLLVLSGMWTAEHYSRYFSDFWDIFYERKKTWDKVYFLFDTSNLSIQSEEFRSYIWENWSHLLNREDFCICIVELSSMKRAIWKAIYRLLKVEGKIQLFRDHTKALRWVKENRLIATNKANGLKDVNTIPADLNLEWIRKHAHIKLVGKDLLWSITACRNIIILKIQKHWTPKNIKEYMDHISGLPSLLLKKWNKIFLIFDVTLMEFDIKDAPRFLRLNWLKFLDREDMTTCVVQRKKLNRFLWRRLLRKIGRSEKVKVYPDCDTALNSVRSEMLTYAEDSR